MALPAILAAILAGVGSVASVVWNTIKDIVKFVKDWVFWAASNAPYPLRVATWVIMFMSSAWLFGFLFSLGGVCTTQGDLYRPNTIPAAIDLNMGNFALANDLNYTWVNATNESTEIGVTYTDSFFVWVASMITYGTDINDSEAGALDSVSSLYSVEKAAQYNQDVVAKSTPHPEQSGIVQLDCDHENTIVRIAGINIFNPALWGVLTVLIMLFPLYMKLLK